MNNNKYQLSNRTSANILTDEGDVKRGEMHIQTQSA